MMYTVKYNGETAHFFANPFGSDDHFTDLVEKLYILYEISPSNNGWRRELKENGVTLFDYYGQPVSVWYNGDELYTLTDLPSYTVVHTLTDGGEAFEAFASLKEAIERYKAIQKKYIHGRLLDNNGKTIAEF